ncbi:MAG: hypothetical protein HKP21_09530 [Xanthomonadales bacterium]|nr:hypothetical protein [Gammaproteobacteria bacterium]MBT8073936.1 hypothetical protein [Gammaproteobacteria bacterium]MBT8076222.1 hypothetical protein [Gammaproteobacteria bacterium]NNK04784.1 hypothetical protein [Xanthomonadales bacterium]NNK97733.1 hypothetical protein [Xanthomonadales bacterium]
MTAVNDLISSPDFLAYKFDFNTEKVSFLKIDRDEIRRVSALKLEYIDPNRQMIEVPLADLTGWLGTRNQVPFVNPPRFIFHTAFCASTFLARCLDVDGVSISLREPQILLDAANAKRLQWRSKSTGLDYRDLPRLALLLLQKHAGPSEKLIIKPINSVNNIIPELLQLTGQTKSLVLYTDARNFLLSTLRKGESGKHVIRAMFDLIRCDFPHLSNLTISATIHMTDWNIILTLWRLQIEQAEAALRKFAPAQVMASLYGEELIHNPLQVLTAANRFLELGVSTERIAGIVQSDERHEDAKTSGQRFSVERRAGTYQKLEQFYGAELDQVFNWMLNNNPSVQLEPKLTGSLV